MSNENCKWCGAPAVVVDNYGAVCAKCWLNKKQVKRNKNAKHR